MLFKKNTLTNNYLNTKKYTNDSKLTATDFKLNNDSKFTRDNLLNKKTKQRELASTRAQIRGSGT